MSNDHLGTDIGARRDDDERHDQQSTPRVAALVLAGAHNDGLLQDVSDAPYEALIELGGRPMIEYVLDALRTSPSVGRVGIVGPVEALQQTLSLQDELLIESEGGMLDNLERGARRLDDGNPLLVITADIPLVGSEAIEDFLQRCAARGARDAYYPLVSRLDSERAFPGVRRTYFHLREGSFTGGNFVLLQPAALLRARDIFEQAVELRKQPVQMARLLGLGFIMKFILRRLSAADMERVIREKLGIDGAIVNVPHATIGFDVDKPDDFELASRRLESV